MYFVTCSYIDSETATDTCNFQSQSSPAKIRVGKGSSPLLINCVHKLIKTGSIVHKFYIVTNEIPMSYS